MIFHRLIKKIKLKPAQVFLLGFMGLILIGAILLSLPIATVQGVRAPFLTALFTSTSAVCVTGLVVVDTGTYWSLFGQLVILILFQMGGLGIMSMATLIALLLGRKISLSSRILMQESLNALTLSGVVKLTKYVLYLTFGVEFIGATLLSIHFIPEFGLLKGIYMSVFHSVSAFCNAGFDIMGNFSSLTRYVDNYLVNIVVILLLMIGGLGFSVIFDIFDKKSFKGLSLHSKVVLSTTFGLILIPFIVILLSEWQNPATLGTLSTGGKVIGALFTTATPRTAGFNTVDMSQLTHATTLIVLILMFIGGSPGSTAGGVKTTTFAMMLLTVFSVSKGSEDTIAFQRRFSRSVVNRSLAIISISLSLVLLAMILMSTFDPHLDFIAVAFECFSALGTVGLSHGITPDLSTGSRLVLIVTMFIGRLGVMTSAFALAQRQRSASVLFKYPEEKVMVG